MWLMALCAVQVVLPDEGSEGADVALHLPREGERLLHEPGTPRADGTPEPLHVVRPPGLPPALGGEHRAVPYGHPRHLAGAGVEGHPHPPHLRLGPDQAAQLFGFLRSNRRKRPAKPLTGRGGSGFWRVNVRGGTSPRRRAGSRTGRPRLLSSAAGRTSRGGRTRRSARAVWPRPPRTAGRRPWPARRPHPRTASSCGRRPAAGWPAVDGQPAIGDVPGEARPPVPGDATGDGASCVQIANRMAHPTARRVQCVCPVGWSRIVLNWRHSTRMRPEINAGDVRGDQVQRLVRPAFGVACRAHLPPFSPFGVSKPKM